MSTQLGQHAIITASDAKYGDFLLQHWLRSLQSNVNLDRIDIHVLDYGLTDTQRNSLCEEGVYCHPCRRDGNITNIRYRDMAAVLAAREYDQVMQIDGGDIIFQTDIAPRFEEDKDQFRAVCHEYEVPFHELIMSRSDFDTRQFREMAEYLSDKRTVNGGVLLGPADKMGFLWSRFQNFTASFARFGIDQFLLNYILHHDGFVELPSGYNYSIIARSSGFRIRGGTFYDRQGHPIPIVHNSGIYELTRPVANFGYGPGCNRPRYFVPLALRTTYRLFNLFRREQLARKLPVPEPSQRPGTPPTTGTESDAQRGHASVRAS